MEELVTRHLNGRENWCVVNGRPHRHELGDFVLRWAMAGSPRQTVLVTGPSDRPFGGFLESIGIEWVQLHELAYAGFHPEIHCSVSLSLSIPPLGGEKVTRADLLRLGTALLEGDMENFLYQHPKHLTSAIGQELRVTPVDRQYSIQQGRPDIICTDADERICIIECKRGELRRSHLGQLIEYCRPDYPSLTGGRLILLLNSANSDVVNTLNKIGIEVCVYSYEELVNAMVEEGYSPPRRENFSTTTETRPLSGSLCEATSWKADFIEGFRKLLPEHLVEELTVKYDYKPAKKLRVARVVDDFTILYVASNAGRLEFGLPIIHRMLLAGVPIEVMKTKGPAVFLSRGGQVPNITIEIKANDALEWLAVYQEEFVDALEHYTEGLDQSVINDVLLHLGATIQDSNASKLQATGSCARPDLCPYCRQTSETTRRI